MTFWALLLSTSWSRAVFAFFRRMGVPGLFFLGICDSSFLFIPLSNDLLLIALVSSRQGAWRWMLAPIAAAIALAWVGLSHSIIDRRRGIIASLATLAIPTALLAVAPDPDEFPELLERMGRLMRTPFDWSEDVKQLAMPVMLVYGDSDMYRPEHIVEFYQLLGGGLKDAGWQREYMSRNRLAILPDLTRP